MSGSPNNDTKAVFFLVDANPAIGAGHLVRCLRIAAGLSARNIPCSFLLSNTAENWQQNIRREGHRVYAIDYSFSFIDQLIKIIEGKVTPLVIIDTDDPWLYERQLQQQIRKSGCFLMYITVTDRYPFVADVVFNQNILSREQHFKVADHTRLLLGPEYFIFKPEFQQLTSFTRPAKEKNLLISFGSADPANLTIEILKILASLSVTRRKLVVVLGGLYQHTEAVQHLLGEYGEALPSELHINTDQMFQLMQQADLAITSAGLTFWELTVLNIPSLVIAASEREKEAVKFLEKEGYVPRIGAYDEPEWKKHLTDILNSLPAIYPELANGINRLNQQINPRGLQKVCDEIEQLWD